MFRPRRPRRPGGAGPGPRRPGAPLDPRVCRAHRLFDEGRYLEAESFGQLSDFARDNEQPLRAAHMAAQAGRAFLEAGDGDRALARTRQALGHFIAGGRPGQAVHLSRRAIEALRARGFNQQAVALEQEVKSRLAEIGFDFAHLPVELGLQSHGTLPPACPRCGGPIRADEIEWIDSKSAECPYCASIVQAKSQ